MNYDFKLGTELAWLLVQALVAGVAQYVAATTGVPTDWRVWLAGLAAVGVRTVGGLILDKTNAGKDGVS